MPVIASRGLEFPLRENSTNKKKRPPRPGMAGWSYFHFRPAKRRNNQCALERSRSNTEPRLHCVDISGFAANSLVKSAAICPATSAISSSEGFFANSNRTAGEYEVTVITGP